MKKSVIFSALILFVFNSCASEISLNYIIKKADLHINDIETIQYKINYNYVAQNDSINLLANALFKVVPNDPLKSFHNINCSTANKQQIYNGHNILNINLKDSTSVIYNVKQEGLVKVNGTYNKALIADYIFDKNFFSKLLKDATKTETNFELISFNGIPSYKIKFFKKDDEYLNNIESTYYFRESDFFPIGFIENAVAQEIPLQTSLYLSDIRKNFHIDVSTFNIEYNIINSNKVEYHIPVQPYELIPKGEFATDFTKAMNNGEQFNLRENLGKIIILDFWFKSCIPCIKSMPDLEEISRTYDSSIVQVVGVNPYDSKDEINSFLLNKGIKMNSVYDAKDITKVYNVSAYPTIYIIDKEGRIAGFDKEYEGSLYDALVEGIEKLRILQ